MRPQVFPVLSVEEAFVLTEIYSGRCQLGPLVERLMDQRSLSRNRVYDVVWSLRRKGLIEESSMTGARGSEVKVLLLKAGADQLFH